MVTVDGEVEISVQEVKQRLVAAAQVVPERTQKLI